MHFNSEKCSSFIADSAMGIQLDGQTNYNSEYVIAVDK